MESSLLNSKVSKSWRILECVLSGAFALNETALFALLPPRAAKLETRRLGCGWHRKTNAFKTRSKTEQSIEFRFFCITGVYYGATHYPARINHDVEGAWTEVERIPICTFSGQPETIAPEVTGSISHLKDLALVFRRARWWSIRMSQQTFVFGRRYMYTSAS